MRTESVVERPGPDLSALSDEELARLEDQVREIQSASGGLHQVFDAVVEEIQAHRAGRGSGASDSGGPDLPERLTADPQDVVRHQREAMVRAVALRDDPDQPEAARLLWAAVVERLAAARHEAKSELARIRREDPTQPGWMELEALSRDEARDRDRERRQAALEAGQRSDRDDEGELGGVDVQYERDDAESGRDEPAPSQPAHGRSGPEPAPTDEEREAELRAGPGYAGGTGGAGSVNLPADSGLPDGEAGQRVDPDADDPAIRR